MSNFNPELLQCSECDSRLQSQYPGQFVQCECGKSYVDQTIHYGRYGGKVDTIQNLILKDLKAISGIGYGKDDVVTELVKLALYRRTPHHAVEALAYVQYESPVADLGGSSPKDLVDAGRGHKVIEYLQALQEGY
jgi:hypothetical protein